MDKTNLQIGADGVDAEALVSSIRREVTARIKNGFYNDPAIARAERTNLASISSDEEFLALFLDNLRDTVFVDINDFEIIERRKGLSAPLRILKQLIWKLLKFYTYRMWTQQNQVNGIILAAMDGMNAAYRKRITELEARVAALEQGKSSR